MIILSIISLKAEIIEMTDVINIANGANLREPEVIKELLSNFYGVKKEDLSLSGHSPFNNTFVFEWECHIDGEYVCSRELMVFWKELK